MMSNHYCIVEFSNIDISFESLPKAISPLSIPNILSAAHLCIPFGLISSTFSFL